jgi:hypothetical protein
MHIATLHDPTIALSPDGGRLAYSWAELGPESADEPVPSGVRVVDLRSGEVETFPLPGAEGTVVESIAWSPDGRWVAWSGARMVSWTEMSMGGSTAVAGRIELATGQRQELPIPRADQPSVGVDDHGVVALGDDARVRFWDGRQITRASVATVGALRIGAGPHGTWAAPGMNGVTVLDGADVRDVHVAGNGVAFPVGSAGAGLVVVTDHNDGTGTGYLVPTRAGRPREIIDVDTASPRSLTLAVDLITSDRPTVARPVPEWPWTTQHQVVVLGGAAAALLLLGAGVLVVRRRAAQRSAR